MTERGAESGNREEPKAPGEQAPYAPPKLTRLGTLAELTGGGTVGALDGQGMAGTTGSI